MPVNYFYPEYEVVRDFNKCIKCRVCERQCANEAHRYNPEHDAMTVDDAKCVNCHRCVSLCPVRALKIVKSEHTFKENSNWTSSAITEVYRQAETGGVLLSSMGNPKGFPVYFDKMLNNVADEDTEPYDMEHPVEMWAVPGIDDETGKPSWEFVNERDGRAVFPVWFFPAKEGSE